MAKSSRIKYFEYRESPYGGYMIVPIYKEFGDPCINGSWGVLPARIFGVHYVDWLHYCEAHGARLIGKNHLYIVEVWDEPNQEILNVLNRRTVQIASILNLKGLKY